MTKGNILRSTPVTCTQRQEQTLSGLDRRRVAAQKDKSLRFTSIMHYITVDLLPDSYKLPFTQRRYLKTVNS